jgi:hypothetical protein
MRELLDDEWVRDVTQMITVWLLATAVAGGLLLTVGRSVFL